MVACFFKIVLWLCVMVVVLLGGVVAIGYRVYRQEKKDSVEWGVATIARLGELAEQFASMMKGVDEKKLSTTQMIILGKFSKESEKISEMVHEYLMVIQSPRMCREACRLKEEVEKRVRKLENLQEGMKEKA